MRIDQKYKTYYSVKVPLQRSAPVNSMNPRDFKGSIQNVNVFLLYYEVLWVLYCKIYFTHGLIVPLNEASTIMKASSR